MNKEDKLYKYAELIPGKNYYIINGNWSFKCIKQNEDSVTITAVTPSGRKTWDIKHTDHDTIIEDAD